MTLPVFPKILETWISLGIQRWLAKSRGESKKSGNSQGKLFPWLLYLIWENYS